MPDWELIYPNSPEGVPAVIKRESVRGRYSSSFGRCETGVIEPQVVSARQELSRTSDAFPGRLFRLHDITVEDETLQIFLGPTDYFEYLTTNHDSRLNEVLVMAGHSEARDPDKFLSNALGNLGICRTSDGMIPVLRRSDAVSTFAGMWDLVFFADS